LKILPQLTGDSRIHLDPHGGKIFPIGERVQTIISPPFRASITLGPFGVEGLADLRQFFCWARDPGQTPRKEPRKEIRGNFLFTRPQKKFDKIIFLLLSRKEKDEISFLEDS